MNMQIFTLEHQIKGQCLSFKLVPTLSLYVKHRLSYDEFTMYTLIIQNRIMDCHGNGVVSHDPNKYFTSEQILSHLVGPCEQYGAHEKLSWVRGAR